MSASIAQRTRMMVHFPQHVVNQVDVDYNVLSALYESLSRQSKHDSTLARQLDKVREHVEACHKLWNSIRIGNLKRVLMGTTYLEVIETGKVPTTPSKHHTPRKKKSKAGSEPELTRLTQMRALANVWKEMLVADDVPRVCLGDEAILRMVKVSCGSTAESWSKRQTFV